MRTMTEIVESIHANGNRGKLPQKVAGLLALTMLTSCLASCDEFSLSGHGHGTSDPDIEENIEPETLELPKYEHLEIEEFVGEPLDPYECSLGFFYKFDFSRSFSGGFFGKQLENDFNRYFSDDYEWNGFDIERFTAFALWKYSDEDYGRENIEIDISVVESNWTHKIISTETDFALVSKAPNGKLYVTGLMDGKLKNDAGLIDAKSITSLKEISSNATYNEILDYTRKEFCGQLFELSKDKDIIFDLHADTYDRDGNVLPVKEMTVAISRVLFMYKDVGIMADAKLTEGIPEDYIDQLLEQETIMEVITEPEETRWRPERPTEPEWTEPIITPEDDLPNWGEEETTTAETEAEIEP